uniref:Uncharacterized protein n=1 Tax=Arundo donax TaxID=35708 RepID=A0A0A9ELR6_ARUDO
MEQNTSQGSVDSPTGRGGLKGPMASNTSGAVQSGNNSIVSSIPQQGQKVVDLLER